MSRRRNRSTRRSGHPARASASRPAPVKARTVKRARPDGAKPRGAATAGRRSRNRHSGGWIARRSRGLLEALLTWDPRSITSSGRLALIELERADAIWAAATWAVSVGLFATVLSSHPGLADGSEGVAGVASTGILHAPGYPSYVLFARVFTWLIPVGDLTLRVGLFSLLCASLSVVLVQLLARRCGAARWAASLGALTLAFSAGFWFYAGFTKHDQFSGLAFLSALYLLLAWEARPNTWRLAGMAAALAIGLGSSWPLTVLLAPAVLYVLVRSRRQLAAPSLLIATAVGIVLLAGSYGFVLVRAGENPAINWGDATTVSRLISLVERSDFNAPASEPTTAPTGGAQRSSASGSHSFGEIDAYLGMSWREFGAIGFLLGLWGAIASLAWRRTAHSLPLLVAFVGNLIGALLTVGTSSSNYDVDLIQAGFVFGCFFVGAVWVAVGATDLLARVRPLASRGSPPTADGVQAAAPQRWLVPTVVGVIAAAALVPLAVTGWPVAHRSDNAYADAYARTVFSELPRHAALFVWGTDLNLPLTYRQVVYHQRPDVLVVAVGALRYDWYRQEIARVDGGPQLAQNPSTLKGLAGVIESFARTRPVFVDEQGTEQLNGIVGYRTVGLVAQILPGVSTGTTSSPVALEGTVEAAERAAGMPSASWRVWPNHYLLQADYESVGLKNAFFFYKAHSLTGAEGALQNVLRIDPGNTTASTDASVLQGQPGGGL